MPRVLVTGAAGFIGSHVVERLLNLECEIVGIDSFTNYYSRERKLANLSRVVDHKAFELVTGDLLELNLAELMQDVSSVVHLAAEPGVRASWGTNFSRYLERNVGATQRLLEALTGQDVERLIFASSSSVYGSVEAGPVTEDSQRCPASPYGLSKLAAEELIGLYSRERGIPATILRYFSVYGPRQRPDMALSRFISAAVRGQALRVFGDGNQAREMTYVSDVVEATVSAMETPGGGPYNVGGGARATVNELIDRVQCALDTEVEVVHGPSSEGDVRVTWADLKRARQGLGYAPQVDIEEGIKAQVKWALQDTTSSLTDIR